MEEKKYIITANQLNALSAYLGNQKFAEVFKIIEMLSKLPEQVKEEKASE